MNLLIHYISRIQDTYGYANVCGLNDTGVFTFNIQNDTLRFSLVYDSCQQRAGALPIFEMWKPVLTSSTSPETEKSLKISHNPLKHELNISSQSDGEVKITDMSGKQCFQSAFSEGINKLNLVLSPGIYSAYLQSDHGSRVSKLIVWE